MNATSPRNETLIVFFSLLAVLLIFPQQAMNQTPEGVLADPIVLGAWLYEGNCRRCHGGYEESRLAEEYEDEDELKPAVESDGCQLVWAKHRGGTLGYKEIGALVAYMTVWEEEEEAPSLPPLPPQPKEEPILVKVDTPAKTIEPASVETEEKEDPKLKRILDSNPIAKGGWLYTQNCHRCHLGYEKNRMGQGFARDTIKTTIADGKTSTQMTPFSRLRGGDLTTAEIDSITDFIVTWEKFGEPLALPELAMVVPGEDPSTLKHIGLPKFKRIKGDSDRGHVLYVKTCASCHGSYGEGYIGKPLNKQWWVNRYDLFAKSVIKDGVPYSPMTPWSEGSGGELTADQIENLVALIVKWLQEKK